MLQLAILGSTRGTNLLAIHDAIKRKEINSRIEMVLSNKKDALILERAREYGLSTKFIDPQGLSREQYDKKISEILLQHHIDLIVLIGYMRILSAEFVQTWKNKIINIHPSLLPAFGGKMDLEVHRAVLAAKHKETGCTVHYVTQDVDAGPVILQKKCFVSEDDTPENLKQRVQKLEGEVLVEALKNIST